ncbi:hypothetical protein E3O11_00555 [Cryobacterium levicorallinum]|uniref:Uncharacterized protein n=1 Tax=Cryobacterium levicorallinum TaxID=995038 RepID=A0A1I2ZMR3_9MICO|nr:DUF6361 family protein [Cryobacterium levicorallinum]TFB89533.1 hypothetical protein E3O11_00555 [Cryobacterium levicorallinum]GEP25871.1 hypothetical protein CLE01_04690 [Cryobacterium levicorallinum]SFH38371.1 hypothetical protein SAMN05216274_104119 [Cryobacterium levicorallinum]
MPSLVAWLDASSEDQRRMREIVNLFSERDSRDELGFGQVRDALSDSLFPGTSTLLTRARYMLLIPWCFTAAQSTGRSADDISAAVAANERNLILALRKGGDERGLLGRVAGANLKTLPSSVYWAALRKYGILSSPAMDRQDAIAFDAASSVSDAEIDNDRIGAWSPTLPLAPRGFPSESAGNFDLSRSEANWLRDRMAEGSEGTLLGHLVEYRPEAASAAPWDDPTSLEATGAPQQVLQHAKLFSFAAHGAALLYNLMLAEQYESAGYNQIVAPVDRYSDRLREWQQERDLLADELSSWDRTDFWTNIDAGSGSVAPRSRMFVNDWLDASLVLDTHDLSGGRDMIRSRERQHKGAQSRLTNQKLLQSWQGASGAGRLAFRWPQVNQILTDLHDGLERTDA